MKLKYIIPALIEQGPFKRFIYNFFITGNAWGMFHINSHINQKTGKVKMGRSTKEKALVSAEKMSKRHGVYFSVYKCCFCGKYHIGKNRDNKKTL